MGQAAQQHWPVLLTCFLPLPHFLPQQKSSSTSPIPKGGCPHCCLALQEAPLLKTLGFLYFNFFSTDVLQKFSFHTLHFPGTSIPLDHHPAHGTTCTFSSKERKIFSPKDREEVETPARGPGWEELAENTTESWNHQAHGAQPFPSTVKGH